MKKRQANTPKEPTQRMLRIGEIIRRSIDGVFRRGDIRDPDFQNLMITIPEVAMTPDLKIAKVYVAPLGGGDGEALATLLNKKCKFVRGRIAQDLSLKYTPSVKFYADMRYDEASRIEALLQRPQVQEDLAKPNDDIEQDETI